MIRNLARVKEPIVTKKTKKAAKGQCVGYIRVRADEVDDPQHRWFFAKTSEEFLDGLRNGSAVGGLLGYGHIQTPRKC